MTEDAIQNLDTNHVRPKLFYPALVPLLDGDVIAALVLSQILYWYAPSAKTNKSKLKVEKYGTWWIAKSAREWSEELGISPKQAVRSINVLVERGLVISEVRRFDGSPTVHCRLEAMKGTKSTIKEDGLISLFKQFYLTVEANTHSTKGKFLTKTTTETTAKTTTQTAGAFAGNTTVEPEGENKETNLENQKVESTIETNAEDGKSEGLNMNADDVMAKFKTEKTGPLKTGSTGVKSLALLWRKRVALEGQYAKPLTAKEVGQLGHVYKALGDTAMSVLDHALGDWQSFALEAAVQSGCVPAMAPNTGFFCQHHAIAVNLLAKKNNPVVNNVKTPQSAQSVAPKLSGALTGVCDNNDYEPKATTSDVQATLAALASIVAANGNT